MWNRLTQGNLRLTDCVFGREVLRLVKHYADAEGIPR